MTSLFRKIAQPFHRRTRKRPSAPLASKVDAPSIEEPTPEIQPLPVILDIPRLHRVSRFIEQLGTPPGTDIVQSFNHSRAVEGIQPFGGTGHVDAFGSVPFTTEQAAFHQVVQDPPGSDVGPQGCTLTTINLTDPISTNTTEPTAQQARSQVERPYTTEEQAPVYCLYITQTPQPLEDSISPAMHPNQADALNQGRMGKQQALREEEEQGNFPEPFGGQLPSPEQVSGVGRPAAQEVPPALPNRDVAIMLYYPPTSTVSTAGAVSPSRPPGLSGHFLPGPSHRSTPRVAPGLEVSACDDQNHVDLLKRTKEPGFSGPLILYDAECAAVFTPDARPVSPPASPHARVSRNLDEVEDGGPSGSSNGTAHQPQPDVEDREQWPTRSNRRGRFSQYEGRHLYWSPIPEGWIVRRAKKDVKPPPPLDLNQARNSRGGLAEVWRGYGPTLSYGEVLDALGVRTPHQSLKETTTSLKSQDADQATTRKGDLPHSPKDMPPLSPPPAPAPDQGHFPRGVNASYDSNNSPKRPPRSSKRLSKRGSTGLPRLRSPHKIHSSPKRVSLPEMNVPLSTVATDGGSERSTITDWEEAQICAVNDASIIGKTEARTLTLDLVGGLLPNALTSVSASSNLPSGKPEIVVPVPRKIGRLNVKYLTSTVGATHDDGASLALAPSPFVSTPTSVQAREETSQVANGTGKEDRGNAHSSRSTAAASSFQREDGGATVASAAKHVSRSSPPIQLPTATKEECATARIHGVQGKPGLPPHEHRPSLDFDMVRRISLHGGRSRSEASTTSSARLMSENEMTPALIGESVSTAAPAQIPPVEYVDCTEDFGLEWGNLRSPTSLNAGIQSSYQSSILDLNTVDQSHQTRRDGIHRAQPLDLTELSESLLDVMDSM